MFQKSADPFFYQKKNAWVNIILSASIQTSSYVHLFKSVRQHVKRITLFFINPVSLLPSSISFSKGVRLLGTLKDKHLYT